MHTAMWQVVCVFSTVLTLHLSLGVHNDTRVVLKVYEYTVLSPPGFPLTDDNSRHHCRHEILSKVITGALHLIEQVCLPSQAAFHG